MSQGGTFSILLLCMVPAEWGRCPSCHGESPTPQAAVRALPGRRLGFLHCCTARNLPVRGGCGRIARAGWECGAGPDTWWQCRARSAAEGAPGRAGCRVAAVGSVESCPSGEGLGTLLSRGWRRSSGKGELSGKPKSASALAMARLPQANPLIRGTRIGGWIEFLMHRLGLLIFFFVNIQRTIRCLAIVFPSNSKVCVTLHS